MVAFVFPGQGAQFEGMGKDLYAQYDVAQTLFYKADELLGFKISDIMFSGTAEQLKQTNVTQPAIFLHSVITYFIKAADRMPDAVAGHSLGEFSALVAAGALTFDDALLLVAARANAMQKACELAPSTMAAVLGMEDAQVEAICASIADEIVVAANYNCPGQLVISGSVSGIDKAIVALQAAGCKRAMVLPVGGAFHSPFMQPAQDELAIAIKNTTIHPPICPIYQNVDALPYTDVAQIKANLLAQLTAPVRWTQTIQNMTTNGITSFAEIGGTGKVLQGMIKKISREAETFAI